MPSLPPPTDCGMKLVDGKLSPFLTTLPPIPKGCRELVKCNCKKKVVVLIGALVGSGGASFLLMPASAMLQIYHVKIGLSKVVFGRSGWVLVVYEVV